MLTRRPSFTSWFRRSGRVMRSLFDVFWLIDPSSQFEYLTFVDGTRVSEVSLDCPDMKQTRFNNTGEGVFTHASEQPSLHSFACSTIRRYVVSLLQNQLSGGSLNISLFATSLPTSA